MVRDDPDMTARGLVKKTNGTTDDPIDDLCLHERMATDTTFDTVVAPSFRPGKAINGWSLICKG